LFGRVAGLYHTPPACGSDLFHGLGGVPDPSRAVRKEAPVGKDVEERRNRVAKGRSRGVAARELGHREVILGRELGECPTGRHDERVPGAATHPPVGFERLLGLSGIGREDEEVLGGNPGRGLVVAADVEWRGPFAIDDPASEITRDGGAPHAEEDHAPWTVRVEPAQDLVGDGRAGAKVRGEGVDPVSHAVLVDPRDRLRGVEDSLVRHAMK
jgi:hypothetical protein